MRNIAIRQKGQVLQLHKVNDYYTTLLLLIHTRLILVIYLLKPFILAAQGTRGARGTSRGKRRGARGARGASRAVSGSGELRRSQRISKAPAQGRGEEDEDEGEDEEEEVLLTSTQQKALQSQTIPPIQQTQQRQTAQQTQQTPPIQQTQQPQQTQQLSAQAYPFQQFQQFQLQQSQQSQTTASGSQLSATSSSTPIFIDSDDREIIIRSRSRPTTPGVETDILAEFQDFGITRPESVDDRSPARSRRGTPAIDANIEDIAPSSKPTARTKRRDYTCSRNLLVSVSVSVS